MRHLLRLRDLFEIQAVEDRRFLPMEGLRGFAVTLVFFVHYITLLGLHDPVAVGLREIGNSGVDLFFVLSGLLIYRSLIRSEFRFAAYARRRIERIYPTFLVVLAIYILIAIANGRAPSIASLAANALLLPGIFDLAPMITVAWSLSYEAFFYIVAPTLVILLGMRRWPPNRRIAVLMIVYALLFGLRSVGIAWHIRLAMFLVGMLLYETSGWHQARASIGGDAVALFLTAVALLMFTLLGNNHPDWFNPKFNWIKFPILAVAFYFLIGRTVFSSGISSRLFSISPLRWLGNMSYSFYLFHGFVLHIFFLAIAKLQITLSFFGLLLPAFAAAVVGSALLFLMVEKPLSIMVPSVSRRAAKSEAPSTTVAI